MNKLINLLLHQQIQHTGIVHMYMSRIVYDVLISSKVARNDYSNTIAFIYNMLLLLTVKLTHRFLK